MKNLSLLKKCVAIFSLICGMIVATNLNAQTFYYNDLVFSVISYNQASVVGHVNGSGATGEVDIPASVNYNGSNYVVATIGDSAFEECSGLTSITIPNSVTIIDGYAFYWCSGLTSITIPNSVIEIAVSAFNGCSGLTSITIPNSVTVIGRSVLANCTGLTAIYVDSGNHIYDSRDNCNAIIKTADNELTAGCMNTIIPNSVTTIGDHAFNGCSGLTSITIPNSVIEIASGAFYGCSGLTSITIPNSVTTIGNSAFDQCWGLTSITIPNSVTTIGNRAFSHCSGLTAIIVDSCNLIYDSRNNCNAIIKTSNNELIVGCMNTIIPNSVTKIGDYAFNGCSGLTSITIPNSVTTIGNSAFDQCWGLTSITIPNSVTTIGNCAFWECWGLTSITIPNSVTTIGDRAFYDCQRLKTVISFATAPPRLGDGAFWYIGTSKLFVPQNCVSLYIASDWHKYFTTILVYYESVSEYDEISVSVYPNPTEGKMIVEADNIKNISIYSVSGQLIYETPSADDTFEYDFGKHGAGVYLVKIETLKGVVTKKVTVK